MALVAAGLCFKGGEVSRSASSTQSRHGACGLQTNRFARFLSLHVIQGGERGGRGGGWGVSGGGGNSPKTAGETRCLSTAPIAYPCVSQPASV